MSGRCGDCGVPTWPWHLSYRGGAQNRNAVELALGRASTDKRLAWHGDIGTRQAEKRRAPVHGSMGSEVEMCAGTTKQQRVKEAPGRDHMEKLQVYRGGAHALTHGGRAAGKGGTALWDHERAMDGSGTEWTGRSNAAARERGGDARSRGRKRRER